MWAIWAKSLLLQPLKSCPKCNKSPNLVTLSESEEKTVSASCCQNLKYGAVKITSRLKIASGASPAKTIISTRS